MNKRGFAAFPAALLIGMSMPAVPAQAVTPTPAAPMVAKPAGKAVSSLATALHGPVTRQKAKLPSSIPGYAQSPRRLAPLTASKPNAVESAPVVGAQVLDDPGFEQGHPNPYWAEYSTKNYVLINRVRPRSGRYSADLCFYSSCSDGVQQAHLRPENVISATLTVWFWMGTQKPTTTCGDYFAFGIDDGNGHTAANSASQYCTDWGDQTWHQESIDETAFLRNLQGSPVNIFAGAVTDSSTALTEVFVDDFQLSLIASADQPHNVIAEPDNGAATISWTTATPVGSGTSSITIDAFTNNGTTLVRSESYSNPTRKEVFHTLTNGTTYTFRVTANSILGTGYSSQSLLSDPATPELSYHFVAVSDQQYRLANSDGTHWQAMDPSYLAVNVRPATDSLAIISGNVDVWTASAGYNQDVAIAVDASVAAWKESGGYAGTFSPNAAMVETVFPMQKDVLYTVSLLWKTNRPAPGATIFAGAGPIGVDFSPSRITVQLVPAAGSPLTSPYLSTAVSNHQFALNGSDGSTWSVIGPSAAPSLTYVAPDNGTALLSANADLWTDTVGYNQDLGIAVEGPGFPTTPGQPEAWKESGGYAGTFSPNAAFVQTSIPVTKGATYQFTLQWKTNRASRPTSTIYAAAGNTAGYSPTRLILLFIPNNGTLFQRVSNQQYHVTGVNGRVFYDIDTAGLGMTVTPGGNCLAIVSLNSDLWTDTAGYNQDMGIFVQALGVMITTPETAGWKESGGYAGTFSPNAAYFQTLVPMIAGANYRIIPEWKPNRDLPFNASIWAGAGPIGTRFSATTLTVQLICPPAASMAFATAAQTLTAGVPSVPITVQLKDASGSPANADTDHLVTLTTTATATGMFTDGMGNPITSVTIPAGSNSATFRYVDTNPGMPTLTATSAGFPNITQVETVKAGPATHYGVTAPTSTTHGVSFNFSVTAYDQFGNQVTDYHFSVHFTSTDTAATLPADYTFAMTDGGTHTFATTLNTLGSWTITASEVGAANPVTGTSGTINVS